MLVCQVNSFVLFTAELLGAFDMHHDSRSGEEDQAGNIA